MQSKQSLAQYLGQDAVKKNIASLVGKNVNQFVTSVVSLVNSSPLLAECDRQSLLNACITASALDLPINNNLGFAWVIPYKNKGEYKAQFQMGYKGFIQLAQRSGQIKTINVTDVREGEYQGRDRLSGDIQFSWVEEGRDKLKVVGYLAYLKLLNGFEKSLYMTAEELEKHAVRFSKSYKSGRGTDIWRDDFDAMAQKTVIKHLLAKYAPMTTHLQRAIEVDQGVIKDDGVQYVDNELPSPEVMSNEKETNRIIKHIQNSESIEQLQQCSQAVLSQAQEVQDMYLKKLQELQNEVQEVV